MTCDSKFIWFAFYVFSLLLNSFLYEGWSSCWGKAKWVLRPWEKFSMAEQWAMKTHLQVQQAPRPWSVRTWKHTVEEKLPNSCHGISPWFCYWLISGAEYGVGSAFGLTQYRQFHVSVTWRAWSFLLTSFCVGVRAFTTPQHPSKRHLPWSFHAHFCKSRCSCAQSFVQFQKHSL